MAGSSLVSSDRSAHRPPPEARVVPRVLCLGLVPLQAAVRPHFGGVPVFVRDLSAHGVGLVISVPSPPTDDQPPPFEPGTRLALCWEAGPPEAWRTVFVRVVWATRLAGDVWRVGCAFDPRLADDAFQTLLRAVGEVRPW